MTNIKIEDIPLLPQIAFNFITPLNINPAIPFPDELFKTDGALSLRSIKANADQKFSLQKGTNKIDFSAGAEGFSRLGVYRDKKQLFADLKEEGLSDFLSDLLNFEISDIENLLALRWGYDLQAAVNGKVALTSNPINITFGTDVNKSGFFTVLHSRKRDETALDSIAETLKSWRIPRMVETADDLPPKTIVIMETFGDLKMSVGVEYGYSYNWVRDSIKLGGLSGDLGLKIEAGVKAQFGYNAVGRYSIALSRPTDEKKIRLQIFRLKQKEMAFAFDGGISGQIDKHPFPKDIDEFIKGVFNLNSSQVLKDFDKWLASDAKLEDLLGDKLIDEAKQLVKKTTGIDPDQKLDDSLKAFKDLVKKWHDLPADVGSLLNGLLPADVSDLTSFLEKVNGFKGSAKEKTDAIVAEIEKQIEDVEFFVGPVGKWLSVVSGDELTSFLANFAKERVGFLDTAKKTLALVDGGNVETQFRELQEFIDEMLNLDKIGDLANTNKWLKERLTSFLGNQQINGKDLDDLKNAVGKLRANSKDFYEKGYAALTKKYSAEINFKLQKSSAADSLIDLTFDFSANETESKKYLKQAIDGDFNELLTKKIDSVVVNKAVLTHSIKRNSHLSVTLPFYKSVLDQINESIAKGKVVETADAKLWVFTLESIDIVKKQKSISKLAVTAEFAVEFNDDTGLRRFGEQNYQISHKFLYADDKVRRLSLEKRFEVSINEYFRADLPSFSEYLTTIDKTLDEVNIKGADNFGSVLTSLDLGLDGRVLSVWKDVPENYQDEFYKQISIAIQRRLRQWIPLAFIQEIKQYKDEGDIYPLLVYQSLPFFQQLVAPKKQKKIKTDVYHWEYFKKSEKSDVFDKHCQTDLIKNILPNVRKIIFDAPIDINLKNKLIKKYEDSEIGNIKEKMLKKGSFGFDSKFDSLSELEREIIERITETAQTFHAFLKTDEPEKRLEALAEFGSKFTDTFNDELGHISLTPKGSLRPLGLILMADIARILKPDFQDLKLAAIFDLLILKPEVNDDQFKQIKDDYLKGENTPDRNLIALQQKIINKNSPELL